MYLVNLWVLRLILVVHQLLIASELIKIVPVHLSESEIIDFVRLNHTVRRVEIELGLDVLRCC